MRAVKFHTILNKSKRYGMKQFHFYHLSQRKGFETCPMKW
ncbi:hypothetical protein CHCC20335_4293 [Bacillus paralicheniformis]|nr:hypothetical protein CHCC20335_4293 [Bacillus paralicheniformis]